MRSVADALLYTKSDSGDTALAQAKLLTDVNHSHADVLT